MDPATVVAALAKSKNAITTEKYATLCTSRPSSINHWISSQLPEGLLDELKATINASTNLKIIPTSIYEQVGYR